MSVQQWYCTYMDQRLEMRVTSEWLEELDRARGDLTRSEFIRRSMPFGDTTNSIISNTVEEKVTMTTHRHRRHVQRGETAFIKGQRVEIWECDCGIVLP